MTHCATYYRRPCACLLLLLLILLGRGDLQAQTNITGIVNSYAKVLGFNAGNNKLRFGTPYGTFAVGNKVLVMQMKGATYNTANTASFGQLTNVNNAGQFEYANISAITGDTITLSGGLCHLYSVDDSVQIISVPVYTGNVNVTGTLTAYDWNLTGGYGGVLALEVGGTLTLNAAIDVSAKGFRGGAVNSINTFNCSGAGGIFYTNTNADGRKGEGVGLTYFVGTVAQPNGRGRLVNGGGSGGAGNTGGGGGANFGAGGNGGNEWTSCGTTPPAMSYGGNPLPYTLQDRVYLGGGGGGPHADNGNTVFAGGNGGGIVMIKAAAIAGNSNFIRANGGGIAGIIADEGGAGGGGGGAVYLQCPTYTGLLNIEARGGNGTSNNNTLFPATCHGPGGGGGGGIVWFSTAATPAGVNTSVIPGPSGTVNNPASPCFNTGHGAQPGLPGAIQYGLTDVSYNLLSLNDTIICTAPSQVTLNIGTGFSNILWSTGATTPSIVVNNPGTYFVQANTPIGCTVYDTAVVRLDSMNLGNDTVICQNTAVTLTPQPAANFTSYLWQDGATTSSYFVNQTGTYRVEVQTIFGCTLRDSIRVTVDTPLALRDTFLCSRNENILLDLGPGYQSALWSTGQTTTAISVNSPGIYNVVGTRINGCVVTEDAIVTLDTLSIGPDTLVCGAINYQLDPYPGGFTSYAWQDGSTAPLYNVTGSGLYWVEVQTPNGCVLRDSVLVEVDSIPQVRFFARDTALCEGQRVVLVAQHTGVGFQDLSWDLGDNYTLGNENPVEHAYDTAGIYNVSVTANYRKCPPATYTSPILVQPFPSINLGPDTSLCPGGAPIVLQAAGTAGNPLVKYTWSTGDSVFSVTARNADVYWAIADLAGCRATDSVVVFKDCYVDIPNAFSPDGDGMNDLFFPRQMLSSSVTKFRMSVYNRWGQPVFETTDPAGRGWDGRFNDKEQPSGVYIYVVDVSFVNNRSEHYQGNVTLLR